VLLYYSDINGVEVNTGLMMGVIEINTPSYQGTAGKDYWSVGKDRDPRQVTNCLPINKMMLKDQQPYLEALRVLIRAAKAGYTPSGGATQANVAPRGEAGITDELERLAALKDRGVLTEEEFDAQKRRVLGT